MTKSIVFDAGPIISLTTNNLLWVLESLKTNYGGIFYIPLAVREELIDHPLRTKRFKFEALQVLRMVREGFLEVVEQPRIKQLAHKLVDIANRIYKCKGNWLKIIHYPEMEMLATALILNSDAVVIDERTTRVMLENPEDLTKLMEKKLHAKVLVDKSNLKKFLEETRGVRVLRSVELVTIAYEQKMLDMYLSPGKVDDKVLLESLLWGVKLHGCAVSRREIDQIIQVETA